MAIRLIINFKANPGEGSNLVAAFSHVMEEVRNEKDVTNTTYFRERKIKIRLSLQKAGRIKNR